MKKLVSLTIISILATLGMSSVVMAKSSTLATVRFTKDSNLEYVNAALNDDGTVNLGDAFKDVAPGEERELCFELENKNKVKADFYMNTEMLKALETEIAQGAGYDVKVAVGDKEIYNSQLGGYQEGVASDQGLAEMNDNLKGFMLLTQLAKGESTDVKMTIRFDGEAMDSIGSRDYTRTVGRVGFEFKVGYQIPEEKVIKRTKEYTDKKIITVTNPPKQGVLGVRTGDEAVIGVAVLVFALGLVLVVVGRRRKGNEQ